MFRTPIGPWHRPGTSLIAPALLSTQPDLSKTLPTLPHLQSRKSTSEGKGKSDCSSPPSGTKTTSPTLRKSPPSCCSLSVGDRRTCHPPQTTDSPRATLHLELTWLRWTDRTTFWTQNPTTRPPLPWNSLDRNYDRILSIAKPKKASSRKSQQPLKTTGCLPRTSQKTSEST